MQHEIILKKVLSRKTVGKSTLILIPCTNVVTRDVQGLEGQEKVSYIFFPSFSRSLVFLILRTLKPRNCIYRPIIFNNTPLKHFWEGWKIHINMINMS